ncbi:hypothetical protein VTO42DRAFT_1211 [Malbranchea cinnamomea]
MSDKEEEWKPNGRPQSTMAISLAAAMDDAFMLDSDIDSLANSVHYKKQMVTIQSRELEALEAKIREAEYRLQQARLATSGADGPSDDPAQSDSGHRSHGPEFSSSSAKFDPSREDSEGSPTSDTGGYKDAQQADKGQAQQR